MRDLEKDCQISAWSIPEVRHELKHLYSEAANLLRLTFHDKRLLQAHVVNAIILYVAGLDRAGREHAVRSGLASLESLLADTPPPDKGLVTLDESHLDQKSTVKASRDKKRPDRSR